MTEPPAVRRAVVDEPAGNEPCLDVTTSEWLGAARELTRQGFTYFDWLTAVDQTDAGEIPGFDVVLHLLDVSTPGALRGHLLRTRVPDGGALPSLTGLFAGAAWHERETHEMFGIDVAVATATPYVSTVCSSARPHTTARFGSSAVHRSRNSHLRRSASSNVTCRFGRDAANGIPGVPPPEWGPR